MNFGRMNDNYYDPTYGDDGMWDRFIDYCDDNDLNVEDEDFDAWMEEQRDRAEDAAAERAMDYARERDW